MQQLRAGAKAGFVVPRTAITTNSSAIAASARETSSAWIQKSLVTGVAETGQFLAKRVDWDQPADPLSKLMPFVYQEMLRTDFQVRVACFGDELVCGAIEVPQDAGEVDVRRTLGRRHFTRYDAPESLRTLCRSLQTELGCLYLSLDVGRTTEGRWCLFDVNTMNDVYWLEQHLPEAGLDELILRMLRRRIGHLNGAAEVNSTRLNRE